MYAEILQCTWMYAEIPVCVDVHGIPWIYMEIHGFPRTPELSCTSTYESKISVYIHVHLIISMDFHVRILLHILPNFLFSYFQSCTRKTWKLRCQYFVFMDNHEFPCTIHRSPWNFERRDRNKGAVSIRFHGHDKFS